MNTTYAPISTDGATERPLILPLATETKKPPFIVACDLCAEDTLCFGEYYEWQ